MSFDFAGDLPSDPDSEEADWYFAGWYTDDSLETPFDFDETGITTDTTVYGKWTQEPGGDDDDDDDDNETDVPDETTEADEVAIWGEVEFVPAPEVVEIPEEEVPLAGPNTGSGLGLAYAALTTGIAGMALLFGKKK